MSAYLGAALATQKVEPKKKRTADQKARIRSLMQDEGETRAAAEAWVDAFEASRCSSCGSTTHHACGSDNPEQRPAGFSSDSRGIFTPDVGDRGES